MTPLRPLVPRVPIASAAVSVAAAVAFALFSCLLDCSEAAVHLTVPFNGSFVFNDAETSFGGIIPAKGIHGYLRRTIPHDACETVLNPVDPVSDPVAFALIERNHCYVKSKVLNAQLAGYSAAIIYNIEDEENLITMSSVPMLEIAIPVIFVSLNSARQMISLIKRTGTVCFIQPNSHNSPSLTLPCSSSLSSLSASSSLSSSLLPPLPSSSSSSSSYPMSIIPLIAISAILTMLTYLHRHRLRHAMAAGLGTILRGSGGGKRAAPPSFCMSQIAVQALHEVAYHGGVKGFLGREMCAICLEDYAKSDRLRLLPCLHEFHVDCVDHWLINRKPCCPICKWDGHSHQAETDEEAANLSASSAPAAAAAAAVSWLGSIASHSAAAFMRWASYIMPPLLRPSSSLMLRMSHLPISLMRSSSSALDSAREPLLKQEGAS